MGAVKQLPTRWASCKLLQNLKSSRSFQVFPVPLRLFEIPSGCCPGYRPSRPITTIMFLLKKHDSRCHDITPGLALSFQSWGQCFVLISNTLYQQPAFRRGHQPPYAKAVRTQCPRTVRGTLDCKNAYPLYE